MAISQRDLKLLWGRAASRCAVCHRELTQDTSAISSTVLIGEHAHIVAEQQAGPRGRSILDSDQRNSYANLILLCPTDHALIDADPAAFPIEKLHDLKFRHELWVQQTLSEPDSGRTFLGDDLVYTHIVDLAVRQCRLQDWEDWTNSALYTEPRWDVAFPGEIESFRRDVLKAAWPTSDTGHEFQRAVQTLAYVLHEAVQTFLDHADEEDTTFVPRKFYKDQWYSQTEYKRRADIYEAWMYDCKMLVLEATKAANWFADVVRRDLNPAFFSDKGRFVVTSSFVNHGDTVLLEYTSEERTILPDAFLSKRKRKRQQHRKWWQKLLTHVEDEPV